MKDIWTVIVLASAVSGAAIADVVLLKDGKKIEGEVVEENDESVILKIPKAKVKKVAYAQSKAGKGDEKGDIALWYTCKHEYGNNGVAIATSRHLLVFDHVSTPLPPGSKAEKGHLEGGKTITAKDLEGRLAVFFFTHKHADHFHPDVLKLPERAPKGVKVAFVFPESMKGAFEKVRAPTLALGHEATKEIGGIKVHSVFTGKGIPGCCYIVEADGLVIVYVNRCFDAPAPPDETFPPRLKAAIGSRRVDIECSDGPLRFPAGQEPRIHVPVHWKGERQEIAELLEKGSRSAGLAIGDRHLVPREELKD